MNADMGNPTPLLHCIPAWGHRFRWPAPASCQTALGFLEPAFTTKLSQDVTRQGSFSLGLTDCPSVAHEPLIQCQCSVGTGALLLPLLTFAPEKDR